MSECKCCLTENFATGTHENTHENTSRSLGSPCEYFSQWITVISGMIKFGRPGAEFSLRAEKWELNNILPWWKTWPIWIQGVSWFKFCFFFWTEGLLLKSQIFVNDTRGTILKKLDYASKRSFIIITGPKLKMHRFWSNQSSSQYKSFPTIYDMPILTLPLPPPLRIFFHQICTDLRDDPKVPKNRGIPRFRGKV